MKKAFISAVLVCLFTLANFAWADNWVQTQKMHASDSVGLDYFGRGVSIDGDYAVVGSQFDDTFGSASIFHRSGTTWTQQAKLIASDGAANDYFGFSVAIDGDYVIVGAMGDDDKGSTSGSAYIFHRDGTSWTQQAKLTASDGAANDYFGVSVFISGDYAVVGSYRDDDSGGSSGSAYVFYYDGTSWTQQAKLTASDGATGDYFGGAVSIRGDYAIVGVYADDDNGTDSGSAYVFVRSGTTWSQQAKLTASDGAAGDTFGRSVAIDGDYIIVGAYSDDDNGTDSGSAYVFHRDGTSWTQQAKLTAPDAAAGDSFGYSVSISDDYVILGANTDDDNGTDSGSAYVFRRIGTLWGLQAKLIASSGAAGDAFGSIVSICGDDAIVGAYLSDDKGGDSGAAYIFGLCRGDLNDDGVVDLADFATFAEWWLYGVE